MTTIKFNQILQENSQTPDYASIDNPRRLQFHESLWQKLTHFKEKKQLDTKIDHELCSFFQERYGFKDEVTFKRIWIRFKPKNGNSSRPIMATF